MYMYIYIRMYIYIYICINIYGTKFFLQKVLGLQNLSYPRYPLEIFESKSFEHWKICYFDPVISQR